MTLDEALLELLKLGLRGDSEAVSRFGRTLLRRWAKDPTSSEALRRGIAEALTAAPGSSPLRFSEPQAVQNGRAGFRVDAPDPCPLAPILPPAALKAIDALVEEQQRQADLAAAGLTPTRSILLTGPPGVGKTMTARFVASRLGLPLFRADLSEMMSSLLGRSGRNLKTLFDEARSVPSVMFLDEFDSLGKRRDDPSDVGELKRLVSVLLVEMEDWPSSSVLIGATNHPELLDRAIWRRFERVVHIERPGVDERRAILRWRLSERRRETSEETVEVCATSTEGAAGSDVVALVTAADRRAVLDSGERPWDEVLVEEALERLVTRASSDIKLRTLYCSVAYAQLGLTQRQIAERLGVSHVTVSKDLKSHHGAANRKRRRVTNATT